MEKSLISIIVPFYNTDKIFMDRCIDSVLKQTYETFECIIVNDGSRSNYAKFLDEYEEKDERVKVVHKENGGLGSARNYGVSVSSGEYVFFLDSDDYISPHTLKTGIRIIVDTGADMVMGGVEHIEPEKVLLFSEYEIDTVCIDSHDQKESYILHLSGIKQPPFLIQNGRIGCSACSKLTRKEVAIAVPFENDKYWDEDNLWNIHLTTYCKRIVVADILWYAYVINPNSMVRGYAGDRTKEFQIRAKQEFELIKQLWPQSMQGAYYHIWDGLLRYCRTDTFNKNNPGTEQDRYKAFCNAIDYDEFRHSMMQIDFDFERRFRFRIVKKILRRLLLFNNKRLAYIMLGMCIRRIRF